MRYTTIIMLVLAVAAFAIGGDFGIGYTVINEEQAASEYGWTGTMSQNIGIGATAWGVRGIGSIHYPEYTNYAVTTGTVLGTGAVMFEEGFGMEAGYGLAYGDEEWTPALYYAWLFQLDSGHSFRPFIMLTTNDRQTAQAGFLVTYRY